MNQREFTDELNFVHDELEAFATKMKDEGCEGMTEIESGIVAGIIEGAHIIVCRMRAGADTVTFLQTFGGDHNN